MSDSALPSHTGKLRIATRPPVAADRMSIQQVVKKKNRKEKQHNARIAEIRKMSNTIISSLDARASWRRGGDSNPR